MTVSHVITDTQTHSAAGTHSVPTAANNLRKERGRGSVWSVLDVAVWMGRVSELGFLWIKVEGLKKKKREGNFILQQVGTTSCAAVGRQLVNTKTTAAFVCKKRLFVFFFFSGPVWR